MRNNSSILETKYLFFENQIQEYDRQTKFEPDKIWRKPFKCNRKFNQKKIMMLNKNTIVKKSIIIDRD